MSEHLPGEASVPYEYFFDEIKVRDDVLESLRTRIREFNRWLKDGVISLDDPEFEDVYEKLQHAWQYDGDICGVLGKLRPVVDTEDAESDIHGPFIIADTSHLLVSRGIELVPNHNDEMEIIYLFKDTNAAESDQYYCRDEDMYTLAFEDLPFESIAWQLERLIPDQIDAIKQAITEEGTLEERVRGLDDLRLVFDRGQFGDYPIIERLAQYIDKRVGIDHRIMHNMTIAGDVTVESETDDGSIDTVNIDISDNPLHVPGYVAPIMLAEHHDVEGNISFIPRMLAYVHSDRKHDEDDEEIGMWPSSLVRLQSLRPARSIGRLLHDHAELLGMTVDVDDEIHFDTDGSLEPEHRRRSPTYFERIRYLQQLIDASIALATEVGAHHFGDFDDAFNAATQLASSVNEILGEDLSEIGQHTFIADGSGVSLPKYAQDGFEVNPDGTPAGAIVFRPDSANGLRDNILMDQYFVEIVGDIYPNVVRVVEENEYYKASVELAVKIIDGGVVYRLLVPGTTRVAKDIIVHDYAYVPLEGSATLELIDMYDARQFKEAMDIFKTRLTDAPDLKPSYEALKQLHRALYNERDDGVFTALQQIRLLHTLGEQGGGDGAASQIIVDTLCDLLGPKRRVSVKGAMYREGQTGDDPIEGSIAGVVTNIVSVRPGGLTEEPMFHILPTGINTAPVYVPLKEIEEFHF